MRVNLKTHYFGAAAPWQFSTLGHCKAGCHRNYPLFSHSNNYGLNTQKLSRNMPVDLGRTSFNLIDNI